MPKDKKRAKYSSDSDSGPEDRSPVKKGKPAPSAPAGKSGGGASASGTVNALPGDEPSWSLGSMKFVKVLV
jgi:hypothetical protein